MRAHAGVPVLDRREGSCTVGCGACCRFLVLQVNPQYIENEDIRRWVTLHGIRLKEAEGACWAYIPTACTALTPGGKCSLVGTKERPQVCETWPSSQAQLDELHEFIGEEVCTYRFAQEV